MKIIKVALIYSTSGFGGMVTNIAKIVNCLNRENFAVILISLENNNPVSSLIDQKLACDVRQLNCRGRLDLQAIQKLRAILKSENINLLSLHGYKANFYGLFASIGLNLRRITTIHGWVSQTFKLKLYQYLDKCLVFFFDAIIAVSPAQLLRHPYLKLVAAKISVIENAIDINEMQLMEGTELPPEQEIIIGTCSRLAKEKRVDILIQACAHIKDSNWKLFILGDGEERGRLESLAKQLGIEKKINFLGYQKDVKPYLHHFDIFVSASSIEGLPNSLLEAGACLNAVIVSDIPEHAVVIHDQIHGLHFPLDCVTVLAEKINLLISDPNLRAELARNFQGHLLNHFSLTRRESMFNALFERIGYSKESL